MFQLFISHSSHIATDTRNKMINLFIFALRGSNEQLYGEERLFSALRTLVIDRFHSIVVYVLGNRQLHCTKVFQLE